jgi:hypothetical protein
MPLWLARPFLFFGVSCFGVCLLVNASGSKQAARGVIDMFF